MIVFRDLFDFLKVIPAGRRHISDGGLRQYEYHDVGSFGKFLVDSLDCAVKTSRQPSVSGDQYLFRFSLIGP